MLTFVLWPMSCADPCVLACIMCYPLRYGLHQPLCCSLCRVLTVVSASTDPRQPDAARSPPASRVAVRAARHHAIHDVTAITLASVDNGERVAC